MMRAWMLAGSDGMDKLYVEELPDQRKKWATARSGFSEADLANASDKIDYALAKVEKQLGETAWLAGETYTLADINFYSHCGMMVERMFPDMEIAQRCPRLVEWRERVAREKYGMLRPGEKEITLVR